jgi:hypothetical protein
MTPRSAAALLTKLLGRSVTEKEIREDLNRGAPTNGDGTIDLVQYAAWLAKQVAGEE